MEDKLKTAKQHLDQTENRIKLRFLDTNDNDDTNFQSYIECSKSYTMGEINNNPILYYKEITPKIN